MQGNLAKAMVPVLDVNGCITGWAVNVVAPSSTTTMRAGALSADSKAMAEVLALVKALDEKVDRLLDERHKVGRNG